MQFLRINFFLSLIKFWPFNVDAKYLKLIIFFPLFFSIFAYAPTGVLHEPSRASKKALSQLTSVKVSSSFSLFKTSLTLKFFMFTKYIVKMDPSMCKKDSPANIKIPFGGKPIVYPSEMNTHLDNLIKQ